MKIYQGESLTYTLEVLPSEDEKESIDNYIPRAVLVCEGGYMRDCYSRCNREGMVVVRWDAIDIIDGIAVFELTTEQTEALEPGTYMLEIALRNRSDAQDIKGQVQRVIEILPSYTL